MILAIIASVLFFDQLTKLVAWEQGVAVLNTAVSFGLLAVIPPIGLSLFLSLIVFALAWLGRDFWKQHQLLAGLFFGGALSNLVDRWLRGGVVDWIPMPILNVHNNVADLALSLAVLLMAWYYVRTFWSKNAQKKIDKS